MQIPEAQLNEFIRLYEARYGDLLTRDEAQEKALRFLRFLKVIVKQD